MMDKEVDYCDYEKEEIFITIDKSIEIDDPEQADYYADMVKTYIEKILTEKEKLKNQLYKMKADDRKISYLCNRLSCKKCTNGDCKHTFDIEHAKNFENIGGVYFEKEDERR